MSSDKSWRCYSNQLLHLLMKDVIGINNKNDHKIIKNYKILVWMNRSLSVRNQSRLSSCSSLVVHQTEHLWSAAQRADAIYSYAQKRQQWGWEVSFLCDFSLLHQEFHKHTKQKKGTARFSYCRLVRVEMWRLFSTADVARCSLHDLHSA